MTHAEKPRRSSARTCLQTLRRIAAIEMDGGDEISEHADSESSEFIADNYSTSTDTEPSGTSSSDSKLKSNDSGTDRDNSGDESGISQCLKKSLNRYFNNDDNFNAVLSPILQYIRSCRSRQMKNIHLSKQTLPTNILNSELRVHPFSFFTNGLKTRLASRQSSMFPLLLGFQVHPSQWVCFTKYYFLQNNY